MKHFIQAVAFAWLFGPVFFAATVNAADPPDGTRNRQDLKPSSREVHCDHRLIDKAEGVLICAPTGPLVMSRGQHFRVVIDDTQPACFDYNVEVKEVDSGTSEERDLLPACPTESVTLDLVHNRKDDGTYVVRATAKSDPKPKCLCGSSLVAGRFEIPFETKRWEVAFAGAFTRSNHTDPVYALSPATRTVPDPNPSAPPGATIQEAGFHIERDPSKENNARLGLGAIAHVNWTPWNSGHVGWSPMAFGLGINEGSNPTYLFGTSLTFQGHAYLTLGWAYSQIDRLPNNLFQHRFVTAADQASTQAALGSLPRRLAGAFVVAVSYEFGSTASKSTLSSVFPVSPTQPGQAKKSGAREGADRKKAAGGN